LPREVSSLTVLVVAAAVPRVEYCRDSTIFEAWTVLAGLPAKLDDTEPPVLFRRAKDRFPDLQVKPAVVAVQFDVNVPTPPFWNLQVTWDQGTHLARFGHRYLSVHFLRESERYENFRRSFQPPMDEWLAIYPGALGAAASSQPVERVGFGYVNRFDFPASGFDVSQYFKLNFALDVGIDPIELLGMTTGCQFFDARRSLNMSLSLSAESAPDDIVRVTTKVSAERRGIEQVTFADADPLRQLVVAAKDAAKETFFSFATDATHQLMGAVHAASSP
jgi:uncharacterized protein (TIGR04255 family)